MGGPGAGTEQDFYAGSLVRDTWEMSEAGLGGEKLFCYLVAHGASADSSESSGNWTVSHLDVGENLVSKSLDQQVICSEKGWTKP